MTTAQHIQNALDHLTMFVAPGADDPLSVAYVTRQLEQALEPEACANCGDPLTDDDGTGYYCSRCAHTMQYHS